jgi:hypothetical protein
MALTTTLGTVRCAWISASVSVGATPNALAAEDPGTMYPYERFVTAPLPADVPADAPPDAQPQPPSISANAATAPLCAARDHETRYAILPPGKV